MSLQPTWPNSQEFWRDRRVTVTGGAGFLGSNVVKQLTDIGCEQILCHVSQAYDLATQMAAVRQLYADAKPNIVLHLRGESWWHRR